MVMSLYYSRSSGYNANTYNPIWRNYPSDIVYNGISISSSYHKTCWPFIIFLLNYWPNSWLGLLSNSSFCREDTSYPKCSFNTLKYSWSRISDHIFEKFLVLFEQSLKDRWYKFLLIHQHLSHFLRHQGIYGGKDIYLNICIFYSSGRNSRAMVLLSFSFPFVSSKFSSAQQILHPL